MCCTYIYSDCFVTRMDLLVLSHSASCYCIANNNKLVYSSSYFLIILPGCNLLVLY